MMTDEHPKRFMPRWLLMSLLLLSTAFVGVYLIPQERYKQAFVSLVHKLTPYEVTINGPFAVKLTPSLNLSMENVIVFRNEGKGTKTTGKIQNVSLEMSLWSLILGAIDIENLTLNGANFEIQRGQEGHVKTQWIKDILRTANKAEKGTNETILHFLDSAILENVRLVGGKLVYKAADGQALATITDWNAALLKPAASDLFEVTSTAFLNDQVVDFKAFLKRPSEFLRGFRSPIGFEIDSRAFQMRLTGTGAHRDSVVMQGDIAVVVPSEEEFCTWLGYAERCERDEKWSILTSVAVKDQILAFDDFRYYWGDDAIKGQVEFDLRGSRPALDVALRGEALSVNSLMLDHQQSQALNGSIAFFHTVDSRVILELENLSIGENLTVSPHIRIDSQRDSIRVSMEDKTFLSGELEGFFRLRKAGVDTALDGRLEISNLGLAELGTAMQQDIAMTGQGYIDLGFTGHSKGGEALSLAALVYQGDFVVLDGGFLSPKAAVLYQGQQESNGPFPFTELKGSLTGQGDQLNLEEFRGTGPFLMITGQGRFDISDQRLQGWASHAQEPEKRLTFLQRFAKTIQQGENISTSSLEKLMGYYNALIPLSASADAGYDMLK